MTPPTHLDATLVLVDFDGPLARLLPGDSWREVSAQVRRLAVRRGGHRVAEALGDEPDHVQCLRIVGQVAPELLPDLEAQCTDLELAAARSVHPAPHAVAFLEQTLDRGAAVAVVTNNDPGVVPLVLDRARPGMTARLLGSYGRSPGRVDDLKPRPNLVLRALADAEAVPSQAVLLGDSVTDVEAGRAAGVRVVGVAEDRERRTQLLTAGALAAVADVGALLVVPVGD